MATGVYEEKLNCGGTLKVNKTFWEISYYFPGPDLRYNGTFFSINGNSIEKYINAYIKNWEEFELLKSSIPKGGEFSKKGELDMTIRIGNFYEGVCLQSYHLPISTSSNLEKTINCYRYAQKRGPEIQKFLSTL